MIFRTFVQQLGSLLISLLLAIVIWVVATNEDNPTRDALLQEPIPIQFANLGEGMVISSRSDDAVHVRVRAPEARWQTLRASDLKATVDLKGMTAGNRSVPVNVTSADPQVTIVAVDPPNVSLRVETLKQTILDVRVRLLDDPPVGFEVRSTSAQPARVVVVGPQSLVDRVNDATADIGLRGAKTVIDQDTSVTLHDAQGNIVQNVNVSPGTVAVHVDIVQRVGYKEVAVKAVLKGNVASGYWVSDIRVDPSTVTLVGPPEALDRIPGYVEAQPVTLTASHEDAVKQVGLVLPQGVTALNTTNVAVRISVEPVLGGITIRRAVTVSALRCSLPIVVSPDTVEVILSGPLPILQSLTADDVQVIVDVAGCAPSSFQATPRVTNAPDSIKVESIVPNTVEINIRTR